MEGERGQKLKIPLWAVRAVRAVRREAVRGLRVALRVASLWASAVRAALRRATEERAHV